MPLRACQDGQSPRALTPGARGRGAAGALLGGDADSAALWEAIWRFLTKATVFFPCDQPATVFLDVYPKELRTCIHRETWAQMFIAALSLLPKLGSNHKALLRVNGLINCDPSRHITQGTKR